MNIPINSCSYEQFDPETFTPLNDTTKIRLFELGWSKEQFQDKSVLDIGCNTGMLSIHAISLGAKSVHACDVQRPFVDFLSEIAEKKVLPITVSQTNVLELTVEHHRSDIVLFMEVLHWAVSQGSSVEDIIKKLALLTNETLYIEFPWSVEEPSISKQTKLTSKDYSPDLIINELCKYFIDVTICKFMSYFPSKSGSKRVLIQAKQKRRISELLSQLPQVTSLDVSLSKGSNESYLLKGPSGQLVAKIISANSLFKKIIPGLRDELFSRLNSNSCQTLVLPLKIGAHYFFKAFQSNTFMLFPYIGNILTLEENH